MAVIGPDRAANLLGVIVHITATGGIPALLTSTSIVPKSATTDLAASATSSRDSLLTNWVRSAPRSGDVGVAGG